MSKHLILWESDMSRIPVDPNEQAALHGKHLEITKKMLDEGQMTDWGIFAGGGAGYAISEGTASDSLRNIMPFSPYIKFKVLSVLSLDEVAEVMKSMM